MDQRTNRSIDQWTKGPRDQWTIWTIRTIYSRPSSLYKLLSELTTWVSSKSYGQGYMNSGGKDKELGYILTLPKRLLLLKISKQKCESPLVVVDKVEVGVIVLSLTHIAK